VNLDAEIRAARGRALGEAVWVRRCQKDGTDPKDPDRQAERDDVVETVAAASQILEEAGFDGLSDWLDMERKWA
jgi:hypothetical protein